MRIISGEFKRRRLLSPPHSQTRPMPDRVKEAVFNTLRHHFDDANVLDLFAGTGNVGLEAVSRGAAMVLMVERNRQSARLLHDNIKTLGVESRTRVYQGDALSPAALARAPRPIHIAFVDPPYAMLTDSARTRQAVLDQMARVAAMMDPDGFIVLRTPWPLLERDPKPRTRAGGSAGDGEDSSPDAAESPFTHEVEHSGTDTRHLRGKASGAGSAHGGGAGAGAGADGRRSRRDRSNIDTDDPADRSRRRNRRRGPRGSKLHHRELEEEQARAARRRSEELVEDFAPPPADTNPRIDEDSESEDSTLDSAADVERRRTPRDPDSKSSGRQHRRHRGRHEPEENAADDAPELVNDADDDIPTWKKLQDEQGGWSLSEAWPKESGTWGEGGAGWLEELARRAAEAEGEGETEADEEDAAAAAFWQGEEGDDDERFTADGDENDHDDEDDAFLDGEGDDLILEEEVLTDEELAAELEEAEAAASPASASTSVDDSSFEADADEPAGPREIILEHPALLGPEIAPYNSMAIYYYQPK
ncbi:MAG: 16S rRNA (guanine(966)-N(2))-methyltransferase RsmD [Planctomycetota bacterium]